MTADMTTPAELAPTPSAADALAIAPELTYIPHDGRVVVVASQLGRALGYERADALGYLIRREWSTAFREGEHYAIVRGSDLSTLRRSATAVLAERFATGATPVANPIAAKARWAMVLTEAGADLACALSRQPAAAAVRAAIATHVLPAARRGQPVVSSQVEPTLAPVATPAAEAADLHGLVRQVLDAIPQIVAMTVATTVAALLPRLVAPAALAAAAPPPALPSAPPVPGTAPAAPPSAEASDIPADWLSASSMSVYASSLLGRRISPQAVGHALRAIGAHSDGLAYLRRGTVVKRQNDDGDCVLWRYHPCLFHPVVNHLRDPHANTRKGAQGVLAGVHLDKPAKSSRPS